MRLTNRQKKLTLLIISELHLQRSYYQVLIIIQVNYSDFFARKRIRNIKISIVYILLGFFDLLYPCFGSIKNIRLKPKL